MIGLCFILFLAMVSLLVFLWIGTYFFQGYIYTEPSRGLFWQAPAAALVLTIGFTIWTFAIALGKESSPTYRPIDTILRFNPRYDMLQRPAPKIWAIKADRRNKDQPAKDGEKKLYLSKPDLASLGKFKYEEDASVRPGPWPTGVDLVAIELQKDDNTTMRFNYVQGDPQHGTYPYFVSSDGWVIELDKQSAPTGIPTRFLYGLLFWNIVFNVAHFFGWFIALWLVLRFAWTHALGFAIVLWGVTTLIVLPMLLGYAGEVALARRTVMIAIVGPLAA